MFELSKTRLLNQDRLSKKSRDHNGGKTISRYKNGFYTDLERIKFSSHLRRLQDKAQVYPLDPNDFARTRLTHSIEVSAIASSIGNIVMKNLSRNLSNENIKLRNGDSFTSEDRKIYKSNEKLKSKYNGIMQDVSLCLESASLLHDIGNPPFGHFGEDVIKSYFRDIFIEGESKKREKDNRFGLTKIQDGIFSSISDIQMINDLIYFDGNAQTFRIVTDLAHFNSKDYGLNLTSGVLGALFKYPYSSKYAIDKEKFGYFYSEKRKIKMIDSKNDGESWVVFKEYKRNPLSFLMEASDDIACIISDFEDAVQKKDITYKDLKFVLSNISDYTKDFHINDVEKCKSFIEKILTYYEENQAINIMEPFRSTVSRLLASERENFKYSCADVFVEHFDTIMKGDFVGALIDNSSYDKFNKFLYKIKKDFVFPQKSILSAELQGKVILEFLLDQFVNSVMSSDFDEFILDRRIGKKSNHKILQFISKNYIETYIRSTKGVGSDEVITYFKLRMVIDHICGMTDNYAKDTYLLLKGLK